MNIAPTRGIHGFGKDDAVLKHKIAPGTFRRILRFGRPYRGILAFFLLLVVLDSAAGVVNPLVFRQLINRGIVPGRADIVIRLALFAAAISLIDSSLTFVQRQIASRVGLDLVLDLRVFVFQHIQKMSVAFFTRIKTGALVSRLNADVSGVRDAFTDVLSTALGNLITVILVLSAMFVLSWRLTLASLVVLPLFFVSARIVGKRLRVLTKESYNRGAEMSSLMVERFNVSGALVSKVFGRPSDELAAFKNLAKRVRDIGLKVSTYSRLLFIGLGVVASLSVIVVYGWGGVQAAERALDLGTVVALVSYLVRLYGPLMGLSNLQVDVMTTLVSFERVFEILDLQPLITEKQSAKAIPAGPVRIEFNGVAFSYPTAGEVSLASLESVAVLSRHPERQILFDITFTAEPGQLVAIVGPSGAGKTTLLQTVARLYDVSAGSVRANGIDLRDATLASVRDTVGMVMQDAHLFNDTIRNNLLYAKPGASDSEIRTALRDAQILEVVDDLPLGLDAVLGDRGHRLSGGERQRIAIARLLLKAPPVVLLDEATSHLDSESERRIQQAFKTALSGRTSLVIAHRLSTVQNADQILVLDRGRIVERGRHETLLQSGKLYSHLYQTQFSPSRAVPHPTESAPSQSP